MPSSSKPPERSETPVPRRWVTLVRHAQAVPAPEDAPDVSRTLTGRGRRDAAALGPMLRPARSGPGEPPPVDRILCSSAARTRETLALAMDGEGTTGGSDRAVETEDALYLASADVLAARIDEALASGARHVLLVGHNPGIERLCARLAGVPGFGMATAARCTLRLEGERVAGGLAALTAHDVARG